VVELWRIAADTPDYGADDATGEGARRTGGRWNRPGLPVLYTSTTRALGCLEVLVHLSGMKNLPLNRYLVRIDVSDAAWAARTVFHVADHVGWDTEPPGLVSLDWGASWHKNGTLLAEVPSIVVPEETNVLINPQATEMRLVKVQKVRRWDFDTRLGRAR
jgi:RES domain-containing protein